MMKKWGVVLVCAVAGASMLIAGANAISTPTGTPTIDLSTRAAVMNYLASHGIDSKKIVIQRGARNYAGPHCPGKNWNCTTSKRVVQLSYGPNVTQFQCTPSTLGSATSPDTCVIVQVSSGAANNATCLEKSASPTAAQSCLIYQTNTSGVNYANVNQDVDTGTGAIQNTTQYAGIDQTNDSGQNIAVVVQTTSQVAKTTAAGGLQSQDGHQTVSVEQNSNTSHNQADVSQSLALTAKTSYMPAVTQNQNTDGSLGPNTAASVRQTSVSGSNTGNINQLHDLDANVAHATTASQTQGAPTGGLLGHFEQDSTGVSIANGVQKETQDMHAAFVPNLSQTQWGPAYFGSPQGSNAADRYTIQQTSTQDASSPAAMQDDQVYANCETSGSCSVQQTINQDRQSYSNTCDGQSCHIGLTATTDDGETSSSTCSGLSTEGPGACPFPPAPPPPPPPLAPVLS